MRVTSALSNQRVAGELAVKAGLVGAGIGVALTAGADTCAAQKGLCIGPKSRAEAIGWGMILGGVPGLLLGSFIPAERWTEVGAGWAPTAVRIGVVPTQGGAAVCVRVGF